MVRQLSFLLLFFSCVLLSCNRAQPEHDTENARDNAIMKADSQPQDHTGVSPDSTKNTPGMNIGK